MTQPSSGGPVVLGDRYELGGVLGRGGMAEVHEGRDLRLGRRVAIKVLRADLARDPSFQARFRREGQSAASLNHPAIVAVYDTGEDLVDGTAVPYNVMEHVDGSTLRDLLHSGRRLLPERAMEIMVGVLDALDYSHRHGIVHRDIKPANVMLTRAGDVKVMDFGIARTVAEATAAMTQTSAVIGTAQYLSPEQARGETVDARSDLYSAGCLLYELLTGRPPFVGDSPVSVAYQHVREEPLPPSAVDPDVPPAADAVTLKALAKDREVRYQTAAEMRADLERALAGRPVEAPAAAATTQRMAPVAVPAATAVPATTSDGGRSGGRRAGVYALLALAVVAVFVGAAFAGRALFTRDAAVRVVVPTVMDKTQAEAERILRADGFAVNVTPATDNAPKGQVIDQEPTAGQRVAKGSAVTITVSTGPEMTTVPPLQGLTQDQAIAALQDKQLTNGGITQQDSDQKEGQVLSSDPASGEQVKTGTPVKLVVSSGKNKVPDVTGQSLAAATSALQDATFVVGTPIEEVTDAAPPGTVLRTDPQAGESFRQGGTVTPTIAKAPEQQPSPQPSPTDTGSQPAASTPPASPSAVPTTPAG
ncbi:MAG: Stk1 family PASTA domain-containing Ser/Thr kinase [Motilibacteraceae bacterium]